MQVKRPGTLGAVMFATILALGLLAAPVAQAAKPTKITICHAAGLADEPANWVTLSLPPNAVYGTNGASAHFNEQGTPLAGHEQDYLGACEGEEEPPPDEFALCHDNGDGTFTLVEGTAEALELEHGDHATDVDPDEAGACPAPPPPDTFDICHENTDTTFEELSGLTQAELDIHLAHPGDQPVGDDGVCPTVVFDDRIDRPSTDEPDPDVVLDERVDRPRVAGKALPFTGLDPTPFLALASLLAASGASALVISRTKR